MHTENGKLFVSACSRCGLCLEQVELFRGLEAADQLWLMSHADHLEYPAGEILFQPGDRMDRLLILRTGKLKISNYDAEGKESIHEILTVGKVLGEEGVFTGQEYTAYGECLTPCHICILRKETIFQLVHQYPEFSTRLFAALAKKLIEAREMNRLLTIPDAKDRLEEYLLFRKRYIKQAEIELSRQTIASAINLSRETVSKKLQELQQEGKITLQGYKSIVVEGKISDWK